MSTREDWQRRLGPLYGGALALTHSTPWRWPTEVGDEARSAGWIVALGIPCGLVAWVATWLFAAAGIPSPLAGIAGLAMLTLASAALVERGLVESIDRWTGQARSPGVAATLVLVFVTLLRVGAVLVVPPAQWLWLLLITAVIGRWAAVFLQAIGDPVAVDETERSLVATPAPAWLIAAISGGVLALAIVAMGKLGVVAMALVAVGVFAVGLASQRRDGGLSPAIVAVAAALGELVVLLLATIGR